MSEPENKAAKGKELLEKIKKIAVSVAHAGLEAGKRALPVIKKGVACTVSLVKSGIQKIKDKKAAAAEKKSEKKDP